MYHKESDNVERIVKRAEFQAGLKKCEPEFPHAEISVFSWESSVEEVVGMCVGG